MRWSNLAMPACATATAFGLVLLGFWLAGFVPAAWDGSWSAHIVRLQPHYIDRFFPFDSAWYGRIASQGYDWDPSRPDVKQDIAFFPLWPMVVRLIGWLSPGAQFARWLVVMVSAALAFASVCAVQCLAYTTLPEPAARTATWLYALCPAASFLFLSYPTGLMNLLCAWAVLAVLHRRFAAAACCAGLVTAGGPLGLGTAMMVWVCAVVAAWHKPSWRALVYVVALGVVSIAGFLAFVIWQGFAFGDPFVFMKAQEAWGASMSWLGRLPRTVMHLTILPDFCMAFAYAVHSFHARTLMAFQAGWEKALNIGAEGVAVLMVVMCVRRLPWPVFLQGFFTILLFICFHASFWPGHATFRLTYCALSTFLGAAWLLEKNPSLAPWVICLSACLLFSAAFLTACGYHVV